MSRKEFLNTLNKLNSQREIFGEREYTMDDALEELVKEAERLQELRSIREQFMELEEQGFTPPFNYLHKTDLNELRFHLFRLKKKQREEESVKIARRNVEMAVELCKIQPFKGIMLSLLDTFIDCARRQVTIKCRQCFVENIVSLKELPDASKNGGTSEKCIVCQQKDACVLQPKCGHVLLCADCIKKEPMCIDKHFADWNNNTSPNSGADTETQ